MFRDNSDFKVAKFRLFWRVNKLFRLALMVYSMRNVRKLDSSERCCNGDGEREGEDVYDNTSLKRLISWSVGHTLLDSRSLMKYVRLDDSAFSTMTRRR